MPAPFSVTRKLSQGLVSKVTCAKPRIEGSRKVIISMGEYSCNSQTTSEDSKSILVAFFTACLCHRLTAETKSLVKCLSNRIKLIT